MHSSVGACCDLNDVGKSTLMQLMLGIKLPDSGLITLGGAPFQAVSPERRAAAGHVIEYPLAYPELTRPRTSSSPHHGAGWRRHPVLAAGSIIGHDQISRTIRQIGFVVAKAVSAVLAEDCLRPLQASPDRLCEARA